MKEVKFQCHSCKSYNKHQRGNEGFELQTWETNSLTDAIKEHVNLGHYVVIVFEESEDE